MPTRVWRKNCTPCHAQLLHLDLSISDNFSSLMISRVLHSTRNLRSLDCVGMTRLTDDALIFLPSTLESISLAAARIGDAGDVCVCVRERERERERERLTRYILNEYTHTTGVRTLVARCPRTHSLDLSANQISDAGAVDLAHLHHLRQQILKSSLFSTLFSTSTRPRTLKKTKNPQESSLQTPCIVPPLGQRLGRISGRSLNPNHTYLAYLTTTYLAGVSI
jgi:Leucine-rich repeat (LRR) protein